MVRNGRESRRIKTLFGPVEVSYEKAHEFLSKFVELEVSRNKIHGIALEEGDRIEKWEEERRRRVFEQGRGERRLRRGKRL